jgi:hypothetical protein
MGAVSRKGDKARMTHAEKYKNFPDFFRLMLRAFYRPDY